MSITKECKTGLSRNVGIAQEVLQSLRIPVEKSDDILEIARISALVNIHMGIILSSVSQAIIENMEEDSVMRIVQ